MSPTPLPALSFFPAPAAAAAAILFPNLIFSISTRYLFSHPLQPLQLFFVAQPHICYSNPILLARYILFPNLIFFIPTGWGETLSLSLPSLKSRCRDVVPGLSLPLPSSKGRSTCLYDPRVPNPYLFVIWFRLPSCGLAPSYGLALRAAFGRTQS